METLQRFARTTRRYAGEFIASGAAERLLIPLAAGLIFGSFGLRGLTGFGRLGEFILPAFGLAFLCALWCADMAEALPPAALGALAGSLLSGNYAGAVSIAVFAAGAVFLKNKPSVIRLYRFALLLGVMLVMLPAGILLGAWEKLSPTDVTVHIAGCSLTLLAAAIETRALSVTGAIREGTPLTDEQTVAAAFLFGAAALALNRFRPIGINLGSALAASACLLAADSKGAAAVAAAAIIAAMRVLGASGNMLYIAVLCCCTLTASLFRFLGKWGSAAGFTVPAILFFALIPGGGSLGIGEILIADAALMLIAVPCAKKTLPLPLRAGRRELEEKRLIYQNYKLTVLSDVLGRIAELFTEEGDEAEAFIRSQLSGTAQSLSRLTESGKRGITEVTDARFGIRFGSTCRAGSGEEIIGDSRLIRDFDGLYLAVISDGMGSGSSAARESGQAVQLLADLVTCGFRLDEAADCVNRLLLFREGGEMYATLDALLFDPVRGRLYSAKHGAPPSYILRRGEVRELYAEALPVGIVPGAKAAVSGTELRRGDAVIMLSDGVSEALGEELRAAIARTVSENEPEIAAKLLVELAAESGGRDDMTVIVAKTERRGEYERID